MPLYPDYRFPKPLSAPLTELEDAFVTNFVHKGMSAPDAFLAAGYGAERTFKKRYIKQGTIRPLIDKDGMPLKYHGRSLRLQRYLWPHIEAQIKRRVSEGARQAVDTLQQLMLTAESENVRLNAARDLLSRAGYDAVSKQETTFKDLSGLTDQEIDEQLQAMLKTPGSNVVKIKKPAKALKAYPAALKPNLSRKAPKKVLDTEDTLSNEDDKEAISGS